VSRPAGKALAAEVRRAQTGTWVALLLVTVGAAMGVFFVDEDVDPIVPGLFAVVAALEVFLALRWWRSTRRR